MAEAARRGHKQACPPHEGGSIVGGSAGCLINGQPAARILDRAGCVGAADLIAEGTPSLLIDGLPAVRRGDAMSHEGGLVIEGSPDVLVGGEALTIRVEGDEAFMFDVQLTMAKLLATRSGQEWMRRMAATSCTVTIVRSDDDRNHCRRENGPDSMNGVGTNSTIKWNPEVDAVDRRQLGRHRNLGPTVGLAHEMVHALHNAEGNNLNGPKDSYYSKDNQSRNEERSTVGLSGPVRQPDGTYEQNPPDYSLDFPTENSFRDDLKIPRRTSYYPNDRSWRGPPPW